MDEDIFFSLQTSRFFTFVIFYHVVSILLEHVQMESFTLCLAFHFHFICSKYMPILNFIVLSLSIFLSFKESYWWKSTGIFNYNLGLISLWTQAFYQNKNIIPLTETQNRSSEAMRRTFFYSTIKELNALNLEPTTSFSLMETPLTNNAASNYMVDSLKVKKLFWFLKNPCFF